MSCVEFRLVGGDRDGHADFRALSFVSLHCDRAAEGKDPLSQTKESQGARTLRLGFLDAAPVVLDTERESVFTLGERHVHASRVRMTCHVGEKLLEYPEQRGGPVLVGIGELRRDVYMTADARAPLELPRLPVERGGEPDLVQHLGTKPRGDPADRVDYPVAGDVQ